MSTTLEPQIHIWQGIAQDMDTLAGQTGALESIQWHSTAAEALKRELRARLEDFVTARSLCDGVVQALVAHSHAVDAVNDAVNKAFPHGVDVTV